MRSRIDIIDAFYGDGRSEDARLSRSRCGQLEALTTMHYIHRLIPKGARVLELGAGTGRYSVALAREGYDVTAVELSEGNLELLRRNGAGVGNLAIRQGDAVDLSGFEDGGFDGTLMLGPMYHLYDAAEQRQALREAVRVTRPGGIVMSAFLSVHAILYDNYLQGNLRAGIGENFNGDFRVRHFPEQLFTGFNVDEFEALWEDLPVDRLATAAADGILELAEGRTDFAMSDDEFQDYARYHLHHCERRDLLGCSSHLLYIGRKRA